MREASSVCGRSLEFAVHFLLCDDLTTGTLLFLMASKALVLFKIVCVYYGKLNVFCLKITDNPHEVIHVL